MDNIATDFGKYALISTSLSPVQEEIITDILYVLTFKVKLITWHYCLADLQPYQPYVPRASFYFEYFEVLYYHNQYKGLPNLQK